MSQQDKMILGIFWAVFYLGMFLIGTMSYFTYQSRNLPNVDSRNLPKDFAVFASWQEDGQWRCQVFYAWELAKLQEERPGTSLAIADPSACISAIRHFEQNEAQWPVQFPWQERSHWPYLSHRLEQRPDGAFEVELSYRIHDDDINDSRYQLKGNTLSEARHRVAHMAGVALASLPFGLGFALMGYLGRHAYQYFQRRDRTGQPQD
jgi:hypothetical protein